MNKNFESYLSNLLYKHTPIINRKIVLIDNINYITHVSVYTDNDKCNILSFIVYDINNEHIYYNSINADWIPVDRIEWYSGVTITNMVQNIALSSKNTRKSIKEKYDIFINQIK